MWHLFKKITRFIVVNNYFCFLIKITIHFRPFNQ